ncbi:MAG: serine hydrolase [Clostridia bacterium]|nr:serine hydrolase [Clostridia bacterium]
MFHTITPEQAGIPSRKVEQFIRALERHGLVMHSLLLARGDSLFTECYWAPFHQEFCHRMYSETKSYVGIAIGLLAEEGKLTLDDAIASHFPEKLERELPPELAQQTIRHMLTMETACRTPVWFYTKDPDRTHEYLNATTMLRDPGTMWEYDSPGSQVLSSLVEKLSGKTLFDYLNEKIFSHLGSFRTATILKTPNGDSWGDSALVCTPRDMLSFGRLLAKGGVHEGKQLIPADYVKAATAKQVSNHTYGFSDYHSQGYGYQIWHTRGDGFAFFGMGGQYTIYRPDLDITLVCTGDNQGFAGAVPLLFALFEELILEEAGSPLPANEAAQASLAAFAASRTLAVADGIAHTKTVEEIDGVTYTCAENPCGIKKFSFRFAGKQGLLAYENEQGEKELPFGLCENLFGKFPQYGYSDSHGGCKTENGFLYDCATSAGWVEERKLLLRAQVIDRYFGNLTIIAYFGTDGTATLQLEKHAEAFMDEYRGTVRGRMA